MRSGIRQSGARKTAARPKGKKAKAAQSITQKITHGIRIVSITSFLLVACVALAGIFVMRGASDLMYQKSMEPLNSLNQASYQFNEIRVQMRNIALDIGNSEDDDGIAGSTSDSSSTAVVIDGFFASIQKNLDIYSKTVTSTQDKKNLKLIQSNVKALQGYWSDMRTDMNGSTQLQMQAELQTTDSLDQTINSEIASAIQIKLMEAQQQNQKIDFVCIAVLGLIGLTFVLCLWLVQRRGRRVAENITRPIHQTVLLAERVAEGDFSIDVDVHTGDEVQQLSDSFQKIVGVLRGLQRDINLLVDAAREGRLDVRADPQAHTGEFRKIIEGVNQTLDNVKTPLDVSAIFLAKLAAGMQLEPLENQYQGYYGTLVGNLNKVHGALVILKRESLRLADAGRSGRLDVRADESQLKGSYYDIIHGFNDTLDAVMKPTQEAMSVISRMAVNDYTTKMSGDYPGEFHNLARAIDVMRASLLQIQKNLEDLSRGDVSHLETLRRVGRRSENDRIFPALLNCFEIISQLVEEAGRLSQGAYQGDLEVRGDEERFEGSFRHIIAGMNRTMEAVQAPLQETSRVLSEMAANNLDVTIQGEYSGQYDQIRQSMELTIHAFNELLGQINRTTSQVDIGSRQVSEASLSLSQGATEQASAIEQLTASISHVASQTRKNAKDAGQASDLADRTLHNAAQGNEKMEQMLTSMKEIDRSSASISRIIQVIDDIAFQTNILALNAAVEAARAGEYGKGFAVVADEVRSLAARSAKAAKETTALIEDSARRTAAGTHSAEDTARMMAEMSTSVRQCAAIVENIAKASDEQAKAIEQIDQGLSQISSVVQTNSATAEEEAASSEELSSQVTTLRQMVNTFRLHSVSD